MRFAGKNILVTGACQYTGFAIARAFLREGAMVWVHGRSEERTTQACARLAEERLPGHAVPVAANLNDAASIPELFSRIAQTSGRLDVLVNNAVDQAIGQAFLEVPRQTFEAAFAVNVFALFACSQAAARMMRVQGGGVIVNIGSNVSERAIRHRCAYVASKGAVDALTRAMALELGPHGIRVNTLAPGYIHTGRWDNIAPTLAERRRKNIPLARELEMDDVAEGVLFLASDAAKGMSGTRVVMDGGCSAQHMPADADC